MHVNVSEGRQERQRKTYKRDGIKHKSQGKNYVERAQKNVESIRKNSLS